MAEKRLSIDKFAPILLLFVVILAFAVGMLWQKVRALEGKSGTTVNNNTAPVADSGSGNAALSIASLKSYAKELDLNEKDFNSCLDDGKYAQKVADELDEATKIGATGTPAFFVNGIYISGAQPYQIFADTFDFELKSGDWQNPDEKVAYLVDGNVQNGEISVTRQKVEVGDAPVMGEGVAKITFIEFSDFECPYCERFYTQTLPQIKENYINTGKVRIAYKQLPLSFHPNAQKAAEASLCAKEQGKFWEMHDKMFESAS